MPVTIPKELIAWVDSQVKRRKYSTRSHAVEVALLQLKESTESERPVR
jgi:Arc/MetJ-type ribon-helix-helix transcriptional regulator